MHVKTYLEVSLKCTVLHSALHIPQIGRGDGERGGLERTPQGALYPRCACNFEIRPRRCDGEVFPEKDE